MAKQKKPTPPAQKPLPNMQKAKTKQASAQNTKKQLQSYTAKQYTEWLQLMMRMRRLEELCAQQYGKSIRGFCHLYIGQEACGAGAVSALKKGDKFITAYRAHALALAVGTTADEIFAELYGKATGCSKGKGGSMHLFSKQHDFMGGHGIVGGQIPLGVGIAFAQKYTNSGHCCITFMGDGAVRQGAFHESLNLAMLYQLPIIFIIENNGYAMGTSVERTSNVHELHTIGKAYGMESYSVDGMQVTAVHEAIQQAATQARANIPTLLELRTYRYKGHSMSDPANYRTREEIDTYRKQDPIEQVKAYCLTQKYLTNQDIEQIEGKVEQEMEKAMAFAEQSPYPEPAAAFEDVYVQPNYPFTTD